MPRGIAKSVHTIFDEFVASLSSLIKVKVAEAVQAATADFLATKFGGGGAKVEEEEAPKKTRRRRGPKPAVEAVAAPVKKTRKRRRRGAVKVAKKAAKLTKNGKRIGRPPKVVVEVKPAE